MTRQMPTSDPWSSECASAPPDCPMGVQPIIGAVSRSSLYPGPSVTSSVLSGLCGTSRARASLGMLDGEERCSARGHRLLGEEARAGSPE